MSLVSALPTSPARRERTCVWCSRLSSWRTRLDKRGTVAARAQAWGREDKQSEDEPYPGLRLLWAALDYNCLKGNAVSGDIGDQTYHHANLIAGYLLSKRTDVYASATFQVASGRNSTGGLAVAYISSMGYSSNTRQTLLRLGLRHKF